MSENEQKPVDLYSIHFPAADGEKSEHMVVESANETSMIKMVIKHLGIKLSRATPREVMDLYEGGGGVIRVDENGDPIFQDGESVGGQNGQNNKDKL